MKISTVFFNKYLLRNLNMWSNVKGETILQIIGLAKKFILVFSVTSYGKTWTNFLAYPIEILEHFLDIVNLKGFPFHLCIVSNTGPVNIWERREREEKRKGGREEREGGKKEGREEWRKDGRKEEIYHYLIIVQLSSSL